MDNNITDFSIFVCPACHSPVSPNEEISTVYCASPECRYSHIQGFGFPIIQRQPVLIDFDSSLIDRQRLVTSTGASLLRRKNSFLRDKVRDILFGSQTASRKNAAEFASRVLGRKSRARILIIGGGTHGSGTDLLVDNRQLDVLSFDIYVSSNTNFVADAHQIPLPDSSVDGVWVQAVLEHVLEPDRVVAEIHRVLSTGGIVYAETPFMQHVHEGAYDFTRYTMSGHRWLFRNFTLVTTGIMGGPGVMMLWAIRYYLGALTGSMALGRLVAAAFFWLRYLDKLIPPHRALFSASGFFFLGSKSVTSMRPCDVVSFYDAQIRPDVSVEVGALLSQNHKRPSS